MFVEALKFVLNHPVTKDLDLNSDDAFKRHRQLISSKKLLQLIYDGWYTKLLNAIRNSAPKNLPVIEIGSGAGLIEKYDPSIIKTDCAPSPYCSDVVDAENMKFQDESLRGIVMTGVLHHIARPAQFLSEAQRCLAPGAKLVLSEPARSWLGSTMCRLFQTSEYYNYQHPNWENTRDGRLTNANCALAWIIFIRDRKKFQELYPKLRIRKIERHTLFAYYLSGGLQFRSVVPNFLAGFYMRIENAMGWVQRRFGTLMFIEIERI